MAKGNKGSKSDDAGARVTELEEALSKERQGRRDADEAYRKLQVEVTTLRDENSAMEEKARVLEEGVGKLHQEIAELKATAVKVADKAAERAAESDLPPASAPNPPTEQEIHMQELLGRIQGLRDMLSTTARDLSQLHADEVTLSKKRARILADAAAVLARAVGATGQAPPPLPSAALEARLSIAPVVDISEVADLLESLRPPKAPVT